MAVSLTETVADAVRSMADPSPELVALGALAMQLAAAIELGAAGDRVASVAKELRECLARIGDAGGRSDDDAFSVWESQLSEPA